MATVGRARWIVLATIVTCAAVLTVPPASAAEAEGRVFCDVPADAWYTTAVEWAKAAGITTGVSDVAFDPTGTTSRAQVVTMLYRYLAWRDAIVNFVGPPPTGP